MINTLIWTADKGSTCQEMNGAKCGGTAHQTDKYCETETSTSFVGEGKGECDILHCVLCCFVCEPLHSWFIVAMYNASKIYKENEM